MYCSQKTTPLEQLTVSFTRYSRFSFCVCVCVCVGRGGGVLYAGMCIYWWIVFGASVLFPFIFIFFLWHLEHYVFLSLVSLQQHASELYNQFPAQRLWILGYGTHGKNILNICVVVPSVR